MSNRPKERTACGGRTGSVSWLAACLPTSACLLAFAFSLAACAPTSLKKPVAEEPPGQPATLAAVTSFTIAYTGADQGVLEPCGCTKGMHGGIGRRASFLEAVLPPGCRGVILACGGLMKAGEATPLEVLRYETLLVALNEMEYVAAGLGPEELHLGLDRLRAAADIVDFPFVLTNVDFPANPTCPSCGQKVWPSRETGTAPGERREQQARRRRRKSPSSP